MTDRGRVDTRARIVEAAARLLRDEGAWAVTTRAVAEAAGVQAPAIYRLFGDKDGLLDAVAEHVMSEHASLKASVAHAAEADDVDPLEELRASWDRTIAFGVANPALFRLLSDPGRLAASPAARAGRELLERRVRRVALTGQLKVSERRGVELIQAAGIGTIQVLLSTPPPQRDQGFADAMYDAVLAQVLTGAPDGGDQAVIAAAVTVRAALSDLGVLSEAERQLMAEWLDRAIGNS